MHTHTCAKCGSKFVYCRACVFRPIRYKDAGFCSKECYDASKNIVESIVEDVTTSEINEPLVQQAEAETIALNEVAIEEVAVEEPIIKDETNAYKKKRNKYKYTSSY